MPCNNKECFDLLELIIDRVREEYGKSINHDTAVSILDLMADNLTLSNLVSDTVENYAIKVGWEEISN